MHGMTSFQTRQLKNLVSQNLLDPVLVSSGAPACVMFSLAHFLSASKEQWWLLWRGYFIRRENTPFQRAAKDYLLHVGTTI